MAEIVVTLNEKEIKQAFSQYLKDRNISSVTHIFTDYTRLQATPISKLTIIGTLRKGK